MQTEQPQDSDLIVSISKGDHDAFTLLFRRRQGDVYRFALHMTASSAIADDVTQDVFIAVMRDAGRYDASRATVTAWLCGIARNQVRRRLERDRSLQLMGGLVEDVDESIVSLGSVQLTGTDDVLGDLTKAENIETLRRAVLTLPVRYRETIVLCDLQEFSYAEAATALGCAVGTVRSRLHRGRALLAVKLTATEKDKDKDKAPRNDEGKTYDLSQLGRSAHRCSVRP